jgi:hypothetical protein
MTGLANFGRVACQFGNTDLEVRSAAGRLLRWRSPRLTTEELRKPWPRPIFRFSIQDFVRALPERTPRSVQRKAAGTRRGANPGEEVHSRNTRGSLYQITRFDAPDSDCGTIDIAANYDNAQTPPFDTDYGRGLGASSSIARGNWIAVLTGFLGMRWSQDSNAPSPEAAQKPHFYPDCK